MTKIILENEDRWNKFENDEERNLSDLADAIMIINRVYELQGKKVNVDVCSTIATRIIRDGFTMEQLKHAERVMSSHRFIQLGYPEFLQYLPTLSAKNEVHFCDFCGEEFDDAGKKRASGMLPALCVKKTNLGFVSVGETRVLCSCEKGKKSAKFWADMPMHIGKKVFKFGHGWYFVFTMDDPIWLEKRWHLRDYLFEKMTPMTDLDNKMCEEYFESCVKFVDVDLELWGEERLEKIRQSIENAKGNLTS